MIAALVPIVQQAVEFTIDEATRVPLPRQKVDTSYFIFRESFIVFLLVMPLQGFEGGACLGTGQATPDFIAVVVVVFVPLPVRFSVDDQRISTLMMKGAKAGIAWSGGPSCTLHFVIDRIRDRCYKA